MHARVRIQLLPWETHSDTTKNVRAVTKVTKLSFYVQNETKISPIDNNIKLKATMYSDLIKRYGNITEKFMTGCSKGAR